MSATCFVDTNVLVYSRDAAVPKKQERAEAWLRHLWATGRGRVSVQVLQEYYVTVTRKLDPGLSADEARADVRALFAWQPIAADDSVFERAWSVQDRFRLSWWDALIVATAQAAGAEILLSEDMQDGQDFDGLRVTNPLRHEPPAVAP